MLTKSQEKLIHCLHTKKGREKSGLCLIEGEKTLKTAGNAVLYSFTPQDTKIYNKLVTTKTPQSMAGVARIPQWKKKDVEASRTIIVLDGVQDPGNVGTILRLCLGFDTSLILINSADPSSPKVVRSSAGALFLVPWMKRSHDKTTQYITSLHRPIYRLENKPKAAVFDIKNLDILKSYNIILAGSEGHGITLALPGTSLKIRHNQRLESLNVAAALAIILHAGYKKSC